MCHPKLTQLTLAFALARATPKSGFRGGEKACVILLFCVAAAGTSQAQTLTTLTTFDYPFGTVNISSLVLGANGNLYGTASEGGIYGEGSLFEVTPTGKLTTLYSFGENPANGTIPTGSLMQAMDGSLYGTTESGGTFNRGTVFRATSTGFLTAVYSFGSYPTDGALPNGALIQATDGNFYGTTFGGGTSNVGIVFKLTPSGAETTLYSFGASPTDGANPTGAVIQATDGNFYGTTVSGGAYARGTVFKVMSGGTSTVLYSFGGISTDGTSPGPALIQASDGNFYGTTAGSVANAAASGTVFKITPVGALTTLYTFCPSNCPNGNGPNGLIQGLDGNLYGTTRFGGAHFTYGTIFKITSQGALTTLYSFCSKVNCLDGAAPETTLMQTSNGIFYGTTVNGGPFGIEGGCSNCANGTVFSFDPSPTPAPYTCAIQPTITSIESAAAFGGYNYFASGTWLEIKGTNLVNPADPRLTSAINPGQWSAADFNGVNAPTVLDNVSVTINGKPAYVWYLSVGQINVQAPEDSATGNVAITVNNCTTVSAPFMFARRTLAPGFLAPSTYRANGTPYMVAFFDSDGAYVLNTGVGQLFGVNSRPAKPGDQVYTYGIGFGDVTPSILPGVIAGQSNTLVNPVKILFGTTAATVGYQGLTPGSVGLYQFNFTVPSGLANGDYPIIVTQNGVTLPQTMYLTVQN
jgi:uncharacterized protein (TIGR03437 family)